MNLPAISSSSAATGHRELVRACLDGDTVAFRELVLQHQNLVTGVCYAALGQRHVAEEAAQEAFVTAWRQLGTLRDPERLRPWLASIARNVALNRRRTRKRDPLLAADQLETEADPAASPAAEAVARDEEAIVNRTLASLPAEYREVLVLFYREDRSSAAVAAALEISEDAVRQRLVRGRRLLQERVLQQVEHTLRRTAPGGTFAVAVLALLPAPPASASILGGTVLPLATGAALGTAGASLAAQLGWLGALVGFACGVLGGWFGVRRAFSKARSLAQHRALRRGTWQVGLLVCGHITAMGVCLLNVRPLARLHPALPWIAVTLLVAGYLTLLLVVIVATNRQFGRTAPES